MSINRNRAKLNKANNNYEYNSKLLGILYPLYWDDGIIMYPKIRKGFKNSNKQIFAYQKRNYRTWKHNRKTQYKKN